MSADYQRFLETIDADDEQRIRVERHVFAARIVIAQKIHEPDARGLCRECGRKAPCRTIQTLTGEYDA